MNELFEIEPTLSPQAEWIEKLKAANVVTYQMSDSDGGDGEWVANLSGMESEAKTEFEALNALMENQGMETFDKWKLKKSKYLTANQLKQLK